MESFKKVSSAILSHIFFLHRGFDILFDHQGIDIHSVKILAMRHHKKQFFNALCGLVKAICYVGLICKMSWVHVKICETQCSNKMKKKVKIQKVWKICQTAFMYYHFIHSFDVVLYMHFVPIRRFAIRRDFWRQGHVRRILERSDRFRIFISEEENCPIIWKLNLCDATILDVKVAWFSMFCCVKLMITE